MWAGPTGGRTLRLLDDFVDATSEDRVRHEAYRQIEEALGLKSFVITWREV